MTEERDKSHEKIWYVKKGSKVYGPLSAVRIRNLLMESKIELGDQVSQNKKDWFYMSQQPEVVPLQMRNPDAFSDSDATDDLDPGKKGSFWLPVIVIVLIIAGGILASILMNEGQPSVQADCTAPPAAGVNYNGCNMRGMSAENITLDGMSAASARLTGARLSGSSIKSANLGYANLDNAELSYVDFSDSVLKGASLRNADMSRVNLENADMRYADMTGAKIGGLLIGNTRLSGAIWTNGKVCKPKSIGKCYQ